jgi:CubicO group peptidase (beta-lactamase class C family)
MRRSRSDVVLLLVFAVAGARLGVAQDAAPQAASSFPDLQGRVDAAVSAAMERERVPGISVGIENGDQVLIARGYGFADVENEVPATEHTVYRIGSITKQFTSAAILLLEERGKLRIGDDLSVFLPDYPMQGRQIPLERLLNHTSGIKGYTEMAEFWKRSREDLTHQEMLELFGGAPAEFQPGERWRYSNSGYYLLGLVIEKVSGTSYDQFLKTEIFDRLGLAQTAYLDETEIVKHRAAGYEVAGERVVNDRYLSMKPPFSAGALGSTVVDLMRWQRAIAHGELLRPETWRRMTTPGQLANGEPLTYGYGVMVGELAGRAKVAHGGGINGFRSQLAYYPAEELVVVVLANTGSARVDALERTLARLVLGIPEPEGEDAVATPAEPDPPKSEPQKSEPPKTSG